LIDGLDNMVRHTLNFIADMIGGTLIKRDNGLGYLIHIWQKNKHSSLEDEYEIYFNLDGSFKFIQKR